MLLGIIYFKSKTQFFSVGFLLGKFISDRQYRIRELQEAEHVSLIKELQAARKLMETSSENIVNFTPKQFHPKYNRKLWEEVAECSHNSIEQHFNASFDEFAEKLINNELKSLLNCFHTLQNTMKSIELENN